MLKRRSRTATLTIAALVLGSSAAFAQMATTLEQAELAGLSPELRAEVEARAVRGNTVYEVLQTMLLNNIKAKLPGNRDPCYRLQQRQSSCRNAGSYNEDGFVRPDDAPDQRLNSGPGTSHGAGSRALRGFVHLGLGCGAWFSQGPRHAVCRFFPFVSRGVDVP